MVLLSIAAVAVGVMIITSTSAVALERVIFEVISAFATVGLSMDITADLAPIGQCVLIALMFAGRVGTITIATGLALRQRTTPFTYPEERPIVG